MGWMEEVKANEKHGLLNSVTALMHQESRASGQPDLTVDQITKLHQFIQGDRSVL
jgi:hypothetical protein